MPSSPILLSGNARLQELGERGYCRIQGTGTLRLKTPLTDTITLEVSRAKSAARRAHVKPASATAAKKKLAYPSKTGSISVVLGCAFPTSDGVHTFVTNPRLITPVMEEKIRYGYLDDDGPRLNAVLKELGMRSVWGKIPHFDMIINLSPGYVACPLQSILVFRKDKADAYCSVKNLSVHPVYIGYEGDTGVVVMGAHGDSVSITTS